LNPPVEEGGGDIGGPEQPIHGPTITRDLLQRKHLTLVVPI